MIGPSSAAAESSSPETLVETVRLLESVRNTELNVFCRCRRGASCRRRRGRARTRRQRGKRHGRAVLSGRVKRRRHSEVVAADHRRHRLGRRRLVVRPRFSCAQATRGRRRWNV